MKCKTRVSTFKLITFLRSFCPMEGGWQGRRDRLASSTDDLTLRPVGASEVLIGPQCGRRTSKSGGGALVSVIGCLYSSGSSKPERTYNCAEMGGSHHCIAYLLKKHWSD